MGFCLGLALRGTEPIGWRHAFIGGLRPRRVVGAGPRVPSRKLAGKNAGRAGGDGSDQYLIGILMGCSGIHHCKLWLSELRSGVSSWASPHYRVHLPDSALGIPTAQLAVAGDAETRVRSAPRVAVDGRREDAEGEIREIVDYHTPGTSCRRVEPCSNEIGCPFFWQSRLGCSTTRGHNAFCIT